MSKIRVHELAKELDKPNKDIMQILSDNKIEVKSHMSTLTEDDVKLVKNYYHKQTTAGKEEPAGKMEEKKETKEVKKTTETGAAAPARPEGTGRSEQEIMFLSVVIRQAESSPDQPETAECRPSETAAVQPAAAARRRQLHRPCCEHRAAPKSDRLLKAEAPKAETTGSKTGCGKNQSDSAQRQLVDTGSREYRQRQKGLARTESPKTDRPAE